MTKAELEKRLAELRVENAFGWLLLDDYGGELGLFSSQHDAEKRAREYGAKCELIEIATGARTTRWYDR